MSLLRKALVALPGSEFAAFSGWLGWRRREDDAIFSSDDHEIAISIKAMPESMIKEVRGIVLVVSEDTGIVAQEPPMDWVDESSRKVFAMVGEEYDELCDRLFAGDPAFSYGTTDDFKL